MNTTLTADENIQLSKMIKESECGNNTESIRKLKHSSQILENITKLASMCAAFDKEQQCDNSTTSTISFDVVVAMSDHEENSALQSAFIERAKCECFFLYQHYTDIFNKIIKKEINMDIMTKVVLILKMIEEETIDQHQGSVLVGKLLKEMYIDAATTRAEKCDECGSNSSSSSTDYALQEPAIDISWREFRDNHLNAVNKCDKYNNEDSDSDDCDGDYSDLPALIDIDVKQDNSGESSSSICDHPELNNNCSDVSSLAATVGGGGTRDGERDKDDRCWEDFHEEDDEDDRCWEEEEDEEPTYYGPRGDVQ